MHRLVLLASLTVVAASSRIADANSCNLYQAQRLGELRVGCPLTVVALPDVDPSLPTITRAGQTLHATTVMDTVSLDVQIGQYPSPQSCDLVTHSEAMTFNRYVLTWDDLQAGDEIEVDGSPMVVPGPGDCGDAQPYFGCQDPIQSCPGNDPSDPEADDSAGCSATSGSSAWPAVFAALGAIGLRRRSRRARRHASM